MIGIILGIGGILVSIVTFLLSRRVKKPVYAVIDNTLIATRLGKLKHLKLLWDNQEIDNVYSTTIKFWNDGTWAIRMDDLSVTDPITICCANTDITILGAFISKTSRKEIRLETTVVNNKITIHMKNDQAFNKGDGFSVSVVYVSGSKKSKSDEWTIYGQIHDTTGIVKAKGKKEAIALATLLGMLPIMAQTFTANFIRQHPILQVIVLICCMLEIILMVFLLIVLYSKKPEGPNWK